MRSDARVPALASGPVLARLLAPVLVLALALPAVLSCSPTAPRRVTLAELAAEQERHDGQTVEITGVVREFTTEEALQRHFVIEDAAQNRVEVLPLEAAEPYVDQEVRAVGRFTFDPARGRGIEVAQITPLGDR